MAEEETKKASWNFSADHSKLVFRKFAESQQYKSKYDIGSYFEKLKELFDMIEYNIEEDEAEKIDKIILIVGRRKKYWQKHSRMHNEGNEGKLTPIEEQEKRNFEYGVRKLQRKILRLLNKTGYLPNKKNERDIDM